MKKEVLILYSRKGCCLCETVERNLSYINLFNLNPPIVLSIVDIDTDKVPNELQRKYSNEVPVLVLDSNKLQQKIELPRLSPRLKEDMLMSWIQKRLDSVLMKR